MNNILKYILIFIFLTCSSCSVFSGKNINLKETIETKLEELPIKEIVIIQKSNNLLTPMFLGIFTSIVLISLGMTKIGISGLIASISCIILSITLTLYAKLIGLIGLILLVVGVVILFKEIYSKSQTTKDIIYSVEMAKKLIPDYHKDSLKENLNKVQSNYTKKIVKRERDKLC